MTTLTLNPQELRPLLHQKLDDATDEEIAAMHQMLMDIEARRLLQELDSATDEAWDSGKISEARIADAIFEVRSL